MVVWNELFIAVGAPLLRSVGGWLTNALEDGKITAFEWKKLVETFVRMSIIGVALYIPMDQYGFDSALIAASFSAIVADMLFKALKVKVQQ